MFSELLTEKTSLWDSLKKAEKPIYLYGMGDGANKIMQVLESRNIKIAGIFASSEFVRGQSFCGYEVMGLDVVQQAHGSRFIALLSFATDRDDMLEFLYNLDKECELYAPDVPVIKVDDTVFDLDYINCHDKEITKVYESLSDELSKRVFIDNLNFKISGNICYLKGITTDISEVYDRLILPNDCETYVDLGAYTGDTVVEFLSYTNKKAKKIIALEPDDKNFKKLLKRVDDEAIENISCYNMAAWDKSEVLAFSSKGGRNSALNSQNGKEITANSVDNLLHGENATIIKFDIEGAEAQAIKGCEKTIKAYHPTLMISAYHKNEDVYALVLQVLEMYDGYDVYLRHHPYIPSWETNYYLVKK